MHELTSACWFFVFNNVSLRLLLKLDPLVDDYFAQISYFLFVVLTVSCLSSVRYTIAEK